MNNYKGRIMFFDNIKRLIREKKRLKELMRAELNKEKNEIEMLRKDLNEIFNQSTKLQTSAQTILLYRINDSLSMISKRLDSIDDKISLLITEPSNKDCRTTN